MQNKALLQTLELMLDDWRHLINTAYARHAASSDDVEINLYAREIERRLSGIKTLEKLIAELNQETQT